MALLQDVKQVASVNLLETESFDSVFGKNKVRKRPKMRDDLTDYEKLRLNADTRSESYKDHLDANIESEYCEDDARKDDIFFKGQSKRIWGELYKVLDCSDVVLQILDARNVPGTRSQHIEK